MKKAPAVGARGIYKELHCRSSYWSFPLAVARGFYFRGGGSISSRALGVVQKPLEKSRRFSNHDGFHGLTKLFPSGCLLPAGRKVCPLGFRQRPGWPVRICRKPERPQGAAFDGTELYFLFLIRGTVHAFPPDRLQQFILRSTHVFHVPSMFAYYSAASQNRF